MVWCAKLAHTSVSERVARLMQLVVATTAKSLKNPTLMVGVANWPHQQHVWEGYKCQFSPIIEPFRKWTLLRHF